MPTFQEEKSIKETLIIINDFLIDQKIDFEIIIVDDNSSDNTRVLVNEIIKSFNNVKFYLNNSKKGFGNSIVKGIEYSSGKLIAIMMADRSDSVEDLIAYYEFLMSNPSYDCVFGDRWTKNSTKN